VDDFFGRGWVAAFNGQAIAEQLGSRLDAGRVAAYRAQLATFYQAVFDQHDPGVPLSPRPGVAAIPLGDRFVRPDLYDGAPEFSRPLGLDSSIKEVRQALDVVERAATTFPAVSEFHQARERSTVEATGFYRPREDADAWLAKADRSIVLGGPGSGKSCLLRHLVLDLLSGSPTWRQVAARWGQRLPVWLPFAYWTRLIAQEAGPACSIRECLRRWFGQWNQNELWSLVEQAIADERLLLVVDGLDEWTSEESGRIASQLLQVFAQTHHVAVVLASRPYGFRRIGVHGEGWQLGELAGLSSVQRKELCTRWFSIRASVDVGRRPLSGEEKARVQAETDRFLSDLAGFPDLDDLAEVPLLLLLLIYLRFQQAALPRRRFEAYQRLLEHLVRDHPAARRAAALVTEPSDGLTDREVLDVLAGLAFAIQERHPDGIINEDDAIQVVTSLLTSTDDLGLGLPSVEARAYIPRLVVIAEGTLGVLVRQGLRELSFFHRSLQEFLAARHLARKALADQQELVARRCTDPRWREVLLGLFWHTSRPDDLGQLLAQLNSRPGPGEFLVAELRAEVAFGDFNCGVPLAREVAIETFTRVERDAWVPHRQRLLAHVLEGLRSTKTRELVRDWVQRWAYGRGIWRPSLYRPLARWPRSEETLAVLWTAIHDEDPAVQRAAAQALAAVASGDAETGAAVAAVARRALDPLRRAAALACLRSGWPDHPDLPVLIDGARHSESPELRIAAIAARVDDKTHDQDDLDELLAIAGNPEWNSRAAAWFEDTPRLLASGWEGLTKLRDACLDGVRERSRFHDGVNREVALMVLLTGFPQDQEVAGWCVEELSSERPFLHLGTRFEPWQWLAKSFRDHPDVVAAVDDWISRERSLGPEVALAALVGRTPTAKRKLLQSLTDSTPHWPAESLLEGWGMDDPEVAAALTGMARGPAGPASAIAHLIPRVLPDGTDARARLLGLLLDPGCSRHDLVLTGLVGLPKRGDEAEIVDAALVGLESVKGFLRDAAEGELIIGFPADPRVRQLTVERLAGRNPRLAAAAWAYPQDAIMRQRVAALLTPLPVLLRAQILRGLTHVGDDCGFARSVLREYDAEHEADLKVLASIGYHSQIPAGGPLAEEAIEQLQSMIGAYGPDFHERRQAAFAGLVLLHRLDVMNDARETIGEPRPVSIPHSWRPNVSLLRLVAEHWGQLTATFGNDLASRLSRDASAVEFWMDLTAVAAEFPALHDEVLNALDDHPNAALDPSALIFLAAVRPRTPLLRDGCLSVLAQADGPGSMIRTEQVAVAADVLVTGFGGDPAVVGALTSKTRPSLYAEGLVVALCAGWPQHSLLDELYDQLQTYKGGSVPTTYSVLFALTYTKLPAEQLPERLERDLRRGEAAQQSPLGALTRPLIQRIRRDADARAVFTDLLRPSLYGSGKATVPRVIAAANGVSPTLATWCREEVERQLAEDTVPQFGFDLLAGHMRAVALSLLDVLETSR
jgi:hypothetical protein